MHVGNVSVSIDLRPSSMSVTEPQQVLINTCDDFFFQQVLTDLIIRCGSQLEPCQGPFQQKTLRFFVLFFRFRLAFSVT